MTLMEGVCYLYYAMRLNNCIHSFVLKKLFININEQLEQTNINTFKRYQKKVLYAEVAALCMVALKNYIT
ncbi:hypothetical protein Asulf_00046 [Archaeoglobus sulfaticallidus PM70-1]|uniref:Uncharacterized protein n=1 Tax=Archaeoglobus sulfaticallidus PM70-1 TaxID=387631 RepID=N0BCY0_9EURY|nr:hypothetical protein Asulf_00046 [Archaeoglobus sulfaticallidus PM70-1]